jgi:hypothetical protein
MARVGLLAVDLGLLAVDPGASTGWAWFSGEELISCGRIIDCDYGMLTTYNQRGDRCIIECPRTYPRGKADPNDLIALARKVGRLEALLPGAEVVYPHTWKGSLSKEQCHGRWLPRLSPAETGCLQAGLLNVPRGAQHDVKDAVCLGLWRLERT